jgi:N-acetylglucosaminyl-diphospho-decaprenol L-rhamnosyltransferase
MARNRPVPYSVVVVTHDSLPALGECLEALAPTLAADGAELVVVDNASRDGSAAFARTRIPGATILVNARNEGFARAANQGARKACGERLVFLNPDVRIDAGSLAALAHALDLAPDAGLAAARLRWPDGAFQPSCRRFPEPLNLWRSRGSLLGRWDRKGDGYTLPDAVETIPVPAVAGAYVMLDRARFTAVGGFDERFFVYMEDTDLSCRLAAAGHPCLFVPAAGAVHTWGQSSSAGRTRRAIHHHVAMGKYFRKHDPGWFSSAVMPVLLAVHLLVTLALGRGPRARRRGQASGGTSIMASRSGPTDTALTGTPAHDSIART